MTHSASTVQGTRAAFLLLLRRLHFYIGLFVGPFIFIASLTGTLYVITPSIEGMIYKTALKVSPHGTAKPLDQQVSVARHYLGEQAVISAVRPAPSVDDTTRVQFVEAGLGPSESRAIFIDPYHLTVTGDYKVYGTSGILPFRTTLDHLHQSLLLGNFGRAYSELAASWMWIAALGGLAIWVVQYRRRKGHQDLRKASQRWHSRFGLILLLGMLFLSVTGITWSQWAGENVNRMRTAFNWLTPQVNTALQGSEAAQKQGAHADHQAMDMSSMPGMDMSKPSLKLYRVADQDWTTVLNSARQAGITADKLEIRPPKNASRAWSVTEIDHRWPVKVDAIAIDPHSFAPLDRISFNQFPLLAKLTRWGVDAHMGLLFGWVNQLVLAVFGIGLCSLIVMGYRIWWLRRPQQLSQSPLGTLTASWRQCSITIKLITLVVALLLGYALPVLGTSLIAFVLIDIVRWKREMKMDRDKQNQLPLLTDAQQKRRKHVGYFIRGVVVVWLLTCAVMTRAIIGGVLDEYNIPLDDWSFSMYLMQGMMIVIYTSVFTGLMSIPLWYFFLGESDPQGQ